MTTKRQLLHITALPSGLVSQYISKRVTASLRMCAARQPWRKHHAPGVGLHTATTPTQVAHMLHADFSAGSKHRRLVRQSVWCTKWERGVQTSLERKGKMCAKSDVPRVVGKGTAFSTPSLMIAEQENDIPNPHAVWQVSSWAQLATHCNTSKLALPRGQRKACNYFAMLAATW